MDDQRPADNGSLDHASASTDDRHTPILTRVLVTLAVIAIFACWATIVHPYEETCVLGMLIALFALIVSWGSRGPIVGAVAGAAILPVIFAVVVICVEVAELIYHAAIK
jgi:hypothetical protein